MKNAHGTHLGDGEMEVSVNGRLRAVVSDAHHVIDYLGADDCIDGGKDTGVLSVYAGLGQSAVSIALVFGTRGDGDASHVRASFDGMRWDSMDIQEVSDEVNKRLLGK